MGISCEEVWRDISDYIDEDLDPFRKAALEQHFHECRHCTALLDGTHNVIHLYQDPRVLAPPDGFHERLYQRLGEKPNPSRRSFLAWTLATAASVPLGLALFSARKLMLARHDSHGPASQPDALQVVGTVAISSDQDDKFYHIAGCSHLAGKPKFISVEEAIREGYAPCVYCIGKARPKQKR
jgi:predicted anti-sigma-YlaC factor YlaD